ncbi:FxsA family protein [Halomonas sp. SH5A2]|uniref:FxsA family protein n=1 Tax=Halomonas sp. SH5A2 TaxID=2749040 RepID=UPI0016412564|nr:FxsA family protein [Halomonas sp. SH5A2]QNI02873.1 FxsA family protein [Halomonas sp. SH5A2]
MPILVFVSLFTLLDFVILFSIGSQIGLLVTLLLVIGTGVVGLHLIRKEGVATFARARQRMQAGEIPSNELFTGAALIFGGALLMAPGFLSDALGLACLVPNARRQLLKLLTALGLKAAAQRTTGHDTSWSYQQDAPRYRQGESTSSADQPQGPIEGDFISRDEPRHRG